MEDNNNNKKKYELLNTKFLAKSNEIINVNLLNECDKLEIRLFHFTILKICNAIKNENINLNNNVIDLTFDLNLFCKFYNINLSNLIRKTKFNGELVYVIKKVAFNILNQKYIFETEKEFEMGNIFLNFNYDKELKKIKFKLISESFNKIYGDVNSNFTLLYIDYLKMLTTKTACKYSWSDYEYFRSLLFVYSDNLLHPKNKLKITIYMTINDYLKKKGIIYTKSTYFNRIDNLKSRILEPIKKDINNHTDIILDYEFVNSENNKYIGINFFVQLNEEIWKLQKQNRNYGYTMNNLKLVKSECKILDSKSLISPQPIGINNKLLDTQNDLNLKLNSHNQNNSLYWFEKYLNFNQQLQITNQAKVQLLKVKYASFPTELQANKINAELYTPKLLQQKRNYLINAIKADANFKLLFAKNNNFFPSIDEWEIDNFENYFLDLPNKCQSKWARQENCKLLVKGKYKIPQLDCENKLDWKLQWCKCCFYFQFQFNYLYVSSYSIQDYKLEISDLNKKWQQNLIANNNPHTWLEEKMGFYLKGTNGIGKSYVTKALANYYTSIGIKVCFIDLPTFTNLIEKYNNDMKNYTLLNGGAVLDITRKCKEAEVLFIDDIGMPFKTYLVRDAMVEIIKYRQDCKKLTFFTSNISIVKFAKNSYSANHNLYSANWKRIFSKMNLLVKYIEI